MSTEFHERMKERSKLTCDRSLWQMLSLVFSSVFIFLCFGDWPCRPLLSQGHSGSWRFGYPDIVTHCPNVLAQYGDSMLALDPSNEQTFQVLNDLMVELNGIFPDSFFHLGGE